MAFLETAKDAYELAKKGMSIELQEKIMELREQAVALQEDNVQLRKRVLELEAQAEIKEELEFRRGMYFRSKNGTEDGPFCPRCYDDKNKVIRLHPLRDPQMDVTHHCRACDDYFGQRGFA